MTAFGYYSKSIKDILLDIEIRSFVMDYFIKLDIAKPIEDYQVGNTKYHLSIGYSF